MRTPESKLEEHYNLADALAVAAYLNVFIRQSEAVKIANLAQLVNVIAPIVTSPEGLFLQTIYHPLRLYAEHMQEVVLNVHVESPQMDLTSENDLSSLGQRIARLGPFPLLDVVATTNTDCSVLTLAVINRDQEQSHTAAIRFADDTTISAGVAYEVNGPDVRSENSFTHPFLVDVSEQSLETRDYQTCTFPAHSLTILRLNLG
jgi:alpha-N-arabinofuranosidase